MQIMIVIFGVTATALLGWYTYILMKGDESA